MSQFCCLGSKPEPRTQVPAYPEAGFMPRPETHTAMDMHHQPPKYDSVDSGYSPVVPLPRYTPRPKSIHEKTLETNNIRHHHGHGQHGPDEKNRQDFEDSENDAALHSHATGSSSATVTASSTIAPTTTIVDDASSAYSFPSSFGHTSTETRDTPPPPYSSCGSSFYARSRASSVRSHRRSESLFNYPINTGNTSEAMPPPSVPAPAVIAPPPMAHVQMSHHHQHHYQSASISNPRQSMSRSNTPNQRRLSWESR